MARLRVGVVLLLPAPFDAEVDALRKALGDGTLGRVPAHLTLVPPVNVREDRLGDALRVLRDAGAASQPFRVTLGSPATFLPESPTLYLPVEEGAEPVLRLRELVFREPLARPLSWPYVPHVTVADEVPPGRVVAAQEALSPYRAEVGFDRVHLLREEPGRVWTPFSEAALGAPTVVGRGGLPLELSTTGMLDAEARDFFDTEWRSEPDSELRPGGEPVCITARREAVVVGVVVGWTAGTVAYVETLVVGHDERGQGIGSHLLAAFASAAAERQCVHLSASAPADSTGERFLRHRGWTEDGRLTAWLRGRDLVLLKRDL
jgi:2'-5' RNA ligase/GNAT superfamily N-acetyltransferase